MLVQILLATTLMMSPAVSMEAPEAGVSPELAPAVEFGGQRPEPQAEEGTRCLPVGSLRVHARPAGYDANCPKTKNFSGGQWIYVDGAGGACSAEATCNGGGTVSCSHPGVADCTADRVDGDGRVECLGFVSDCS